MKLIALTKGYDAMVSDVDYERLIQHTWWLADSSQSGTFYAYTQVAKKTIMMHRMITNCPKGMVVDHLDRNGLNNQRSNLRITTPSMNSANRPVWGLIPYKGVSMDKRKFRARVRAPEGQVQIGNYSTPIEAAKAYDRAAFELYGEFAYLNFREDFDIPDHDFPEIEIPF